MHVPLTSGMVKTADLAFVAKIKHVDSVDKNTYFNFVVHVTGFEEYDLRDLLAFEVEFLHMKLPTTRSTNILV